MTDLKQLQLNFGKPTSIRSGDDLDYSSVYKDRNLSQYLNKLERMVPYTNEEERFQNLVNPSLSKNSPYHRWGRYREAYSGELVKELISRAGINPTHHYVLDPMCGSGSTLVAAVQAGFDSIGSDVNPYSIDLSSAKLYPYSHKDLIEVEEFIDISSSWRDDHQYSLIDGHEYFRKEKFNELRSILNRIRSVSNNPVRHLLFVAWLTIIEDCSERRKDGNGLMTRPSPVSDVWSRFVAQVKLFITDIRYSPLPKTPKAKAEIASALKASDLINAFSVQTGKELGLVVFSPPYANSFDYFESYKLELLLGEYVDKNGLAQAREAAIRSYRKGYGYQLTTNNQLVEGLVEEVRARIPEKEARTGQIDGRSRLVPNLLIGYFEDMEKVLISLSEGMPSGAMCYIVVDQSSYLGTIIPTDLILMESALRHNFRAKELIRCRRAATSAQQFKQYPYLKEMLRESIVSLEKI